MKQHAFKTPTVGTNIEYLIFFSFRTNVFTLWHVIKVLATLCALTTDDPVVVGGGSKPGEKKKNGEKKKKALVTMEELTPLGYHLSSLPVDPRIGL